MESHPSGFDIESSAAEPLVFGALGLGVAAPFFTRFFAAPDVELALRFTPDAGELDLPLVAGVISLMSWRWDLKV
jgi:hypothetical protein